MADSIRNGLAGESEMISNQKRNSMTRREMLKQAARASAAPTINRGRFRLFAFSRTTYSARAIELMKRATVIDMLSPFIISPSLGALS